MYYVLAGLVFLLYWTPAIVGYVRHVRNLESVMMIDAFLGWTIIGWVVALAMACRSRPSHLELNLQQLSADYGAAKEESNPVV